MAATTQALLVKYQVVITNAKLQGNMTNTRLTVELLIAMALDMCKRTLVKESYTEQKRNGEIRLATTNNKKKCFKCGK